MDSYRHSKITALEKDSYLISQTNFSNITTKSNNFSRIFMEDFTFLNSKSLGTNQFQQANAYREIRNHTQHIDMVIERTGDSGGFFLGVRCRDFNEDDYNRQINSRHIIKLKHDLTEVMWTYKIMSYQLIYNSGPVNEKDYFIVDDLGKNVYTIYYTASGVEIDNI